MKSFVFKNFKLGFYFKVRDGLRIRVGVGDGFRVRDRNSVNAKGRLGFMHYGLKLLKLKFRSGG